MTFQAGPIPESLGELDDLRYLSLDGNNFSGSIPDVFHELTNLGMFTVSVSAILCFFQ